MNFFFGAVYFYYECYKCMYLIFYVNVVGARGGPLAAQSCADISI